MLVLAVDTQPGFVESSEQGLLDKGAFTQLHDAAQRSGLVPNADVIAHTRDREFRLKDYQKAFQLIEGLFGKFMRSRHVNASNGCDARNSTLPPAKFTSLPSS